jgi:hypothetical protein
MVVKSHAPQIEWTGTLRSMPNDLVVVPGVFDGFVVELFVSADYGTGFLDLPGHQDLCFDAYEQFSAFIDRRRIVPFRLLEWARACPESGWLARPEGHVEKLGGSALELVFDVSVGGTRFPIIVEADLHPYWPVGMTDDALARAALEVCYASFDQDRHRVRDLGFDCSLVDWQAGDPPIPGWYPGN